MKELLKLARSSIKAFFQNKEISTNLFPEKKGVFVTIYDKKDRLRGCIGFTRSEHLGKATIRAARLALEDTRFSPLNENEKFKLEISVLTEPKPVNISSPKEYPKKIKIGKDGLIVSCGTFSGLLLPQVALKHKMNSKKFLEETCLKAGLPEDFWKNPHCKVQKFNVKILKEKQAL